MEGQAYADFIDSVRKEIFAEARTQAASSVWKDQENVHDDNEGDAEQAQSHLEAYRKERGAEDQRAAREAESARRQAEELALARQRAAEARRAQEERERLARLEEEAEARRMAIREQELKDREEEDRALARQLAEIGIRPEELNRLVSEAFQLGDRFDRNDELTMAEMEANLNGTAYEGAMQFIVQRCKTLDRDHTGSLNRNEMTYALVQYIAHVIRQTGSGKYTGEEFKEQARRNPRGDPALLPKGPRSKFSLAKGSILPANERFPHSPSVTLTASCTVMVTNVYNSLASTTV